MARFAGGFGGPEWSSMSCWKMRVPHGMARFAGGVGGTLGGGLTSLGRKTRLNQLKKARKRKTNINENNSRKLFRWWKY